VNPTCYGVKLRPGDCWELRRVKCTEPTDAILWAQAASQDTGLAYAISSGVGMVLFRNGVRMKIPTGNVLGHPGESNVNKPQ